MQTLSCSSWDLAPRSRVESRPPALGVGSCSHWTTRVVPMSANFETLKILPLYFHETFANSGPWRFQRPPHPHWVLQNVKEEVLLESVSEKESSTASPQSFPNPPTHGQTQPPLPVDGTSPQGLLWTPRLCSCNSALHLLLDKFLLPSLWAPEGQGPGLYLHPWPQCLAHKVGEGSLSIYWVNQQMTYVSSRNNLAWERQGNSFCVCVSHSHVRLFATTWTVACQAPLFMLFSRQEYWSGLPCPSPGNLPDPRDQTQVSCIAGGFLYHLN